MPTETIDNFSELNGKLKKVLAHVGPIVCNVSLPTKTALEPRLGWDTGIEDQLPFLDRDEFYSNLYIEPLDGKDETDKNLP